MARYLGPTCKLSLREGTDLFLKSWGNSLENKCKLDLSEILEQRLDNIAYRMGYGSTRTESRQWVSHKAILVNGKNTNIPSCKVQKGDVVEVREKSKNQVRIITAMSVAEQLGFPDRVEVNAKNLSGVFKHIPDRDELSSELEEQLVVELFSK